MKRLLTIILIICLSMTLIGCGGNSEPTAQDNGKPAAEVEQEPANDSGTEPTQGANQEMTVKIGQG